MQRWVVYSHCYLGYAHSYAPKTCQEFPNGNASQHAARRSDIEPISRQKFKSVPWKRRCFSRPPNTRPNNVLLNKSHWSEREADIVPLALQQLNGFSMACKAGCGENQKGGMIWATQGRIVLVGLRIIHTSYIEKNSRKLTSSYV